VGGLKQDVAAANEAKQALLHERYRHLRANVRRRRMGYGLFILFALAVFATSIVDIVYLKDALKLTLVFPLYAVLFIMAIVLLFSRANQNADLQELRSLAKTLLQCPDCTNVFQYGQIRFHDRKKTAFSCPVCGVYSQLPDPTAEPVKALRPSGAFHELQYRCNNCNEALAVGTFGQTPLHLVRFRACPNCGEKGFVQLLNAAPEQEQDFTAAPAVHGLA
jgi:Zn finger protein HypA/HybF involved in hydrogenase expression